MTTATATTAPRSSDVEASRTLMNRQPRCILDLYSKEKVRRLYEHLHNDNPQHRYVFGFQRNGNPVYKNADRFKRLPVKDSIDWSIRTIEGIDQPDKRHAYVPLPNNPEHKAGGADWTSTRMNLMN